MNGRINTTAFHFVQLFEYSALTVMASAVALLSVSISDVKTGSSFNQMNNYPSYCWPVCFSKGGGWMHICFTFEEKKKKRKRERRKEKAKLQTQSAGSMRSLVTLIREL